MNTSTIAPFHLAFPVHDLDATRSFYCDLLGCRPGRSSDNWIDLDLFGHQIVAHQVDQGNSVGAESDSGSSQVDGHSVPVPHFGVVLPWDQWQDLADRLRREGLQFEIDPHIRFPDQPGEQATMFFRDPSGNARLL